MRYTAEQLARIWIDAASLDINAVSFKGGVQQGTGSFPVDTGALRASTYVSTATDFPNGTSTATINIGDSLKYAGALQYRDLVGLTNKPNKHKGFLEKFTKTAFRAELLKQDGIVNVTIR